MIKKNPLPKGHLGMTSLFLYAYTDCPKSYKEFQNMISITCSDLTLKHMK